MVRLVVVGAITVMAAGCYNPDIPHIPPQTVSGKLDITIEQVSLGCVKTRFAANLTRNGYTVTSPEPYMLIADRGNPTQRAVYQLNQIGADVRVVADVYQVGNAGETTPLPVSQVGQINFQAAGDSVGKVCAGR